MAFASISNKLKITTWPNIEELHTYSPKKANGKILKNISFSKDGNFMVLVPSNSFAEICTIENSTFKLLHTISYIEQPTWAAFSKTNTKFIALTTSDGRVLIYDIKNKKESKSFPKRNCSLYKIEYMNNDNHLVAGSTKGELHVFSNTKNIVSSNFKLENTLINTFCCHPDNKNLIYCGQNDGKISIWDVYTNKKRTSVELHVAPITNVTCSTNHNDLLISTSSNNNLSVFDIKSNKNIIKIAENFTTADICPDSNYLVAGAADGMILIYDFRNLKQIVKSYKLHDSFVKQIVFQKTLKDNKSSFLHVSRDVSQTQSFNSPSYYDSFNLSVNHSLLPGSPVVDSFIGSMNVNSLEGDELPNTLNSPLVYSLNNIKLNKEETTNKSKLLDSLQRNRKSVFIDVTNSPEIQRADVNKKIETTAKTSTPKIETLSKVSIEDSSESPILTTEKNLFINIPKTPQATLHEIGNNNVNFAQLEDYMSKFKEELVWEVKHGIFAARDSILIAQIKDTLALETLYGNLKDDLLASTLNGPSEIETLRRENRMLKQENALLKKKLEEK